MLGRLLVPLTVVLIGCAASSAPPSPRPPMVAASAPAAPREPATAVEEEGLEEHQIREVVESKNVAVRGCHTIEYAGRNEDDQIAVTGGTMTVDLEINPDGTVASAEITESDFDNRPMHECVLDITRNLRFPSAAGSTELSWRFKFRGEG